MPCEVKLTVIELKITHWAYGGSVEKIVIFEHVGDTWESTDGDIALELIADR